MTLTPTLEDLAALKTRLLMARVSLVEQEPFLGSLTLQMPTFVEAREGLTTACVTSDGECILSPDFMARLSTPALRAVLLHETLHLALDVFHRRGTRHLRLWNMAHDYAVNQLIEDAKFPSDFLTWPKDFEPLLSPRFKGMTAEQIYDTLLGELPEAPDDWEGDVVEVPGGAGSHAEGQRALRRRWQRAMISAAEHALRQKAYGSLPGWVQKLIGPLLAPKVPWQEQLAQRVHGRFSGRVRTFARVGRRSHAVGESLPGPRKNLGVVGVFIDVSGSISHTELSAFLAELKGILDQVQVQARVITWDADVQEEAILDPDEDMQTMLAARSLRLVGGGGTDPACVIKHLERDDGELPMPSYGVLLTDGWVPWPDPGDWPLDLLVVTTGPLPPEGYDHIQLGTEPPDPFDSEQEP